MFDMKHKFDPNLLHQLENDLMTSENQDHIKQLLIQHHYDVEIVKDVLWKEMNSSKSRKKSKHPPQPQLPSSTDDIYIKFVSSKSSHQIHVVFGSQSCILRVGDFHIFKPSKHQMYVLVIKNDGQVFTGTMSELIELKSMHNNVIFDILKCHIKGNLSLPFKHLLKSNVLQLQSVAYNNGFPDDLIVKTDTVDAVFVCDLIQAVDFSVTSYEQVINISRSLSTISSKSCHLHSLFLRKSASEFEKCILMVSLFIQLGFDAFVAYGNSWYVLIRSEPNIYLNCHGLALLEPQLILMFNASFFGINMQPQVLQFDISNPLRWNAVEHHSHSSNKPAGLYFPQKSSNLKEIENLWHHHISRILSIQNVDTMSKLLYTMLQAIEDQRDVEKYSNMIKHLLPNQSQFYGIHHHFNEIDSVNAWLMSGDVQQMIRCSQIFMQVRAFNYVGECVSIRVFIGAIQ